MEKLYFDYRKFKVFFAENNLKDAIALKMWRKSHQSIIKKAYYTKTKKGISGLYYFDENDEYIWDNDKTVEKCFVTEKPTPLTEDE